MTSLLVQLRRHGVAYLALLVAVLTAMTGTAYAAARIADGSVTTAKLAPGAVTSAKIRNRSIQSSDLAPNVVPQRAYAHFRGTGSTPPTGADRVGVSDTFDLPRVGSVMVRVDLREVQVTCSSAEATAHLGLVDGTKPLLGSGIVVPAGVQALPATLSAFPRLTSGRHRVEAVAFCTPGTVSSASVSQPSWEEVLVLSDYRAVPIDRQ